MEDTFSGSSHLSTEDVPHFHHAALLGVQLGSLELETGTTHTYRNRSESTWSWVILSAVGCLQPWSLVGQTRELRYKVSRPTSCTLYILLSPTHTNAQKCTIKLWTVLITAGHHLCTKTQLWHVWVEVRDMALTVYYGTQCRVFIHAHLCFSAAAILWVQKKKRTTWSAKT